MKIWKYCKGKISSKIRNSGKDNIISFSKINIYKYKIKIVGNINKFTTSKNCACMNLEIVIMGNNNSVVIKNNFKGGNLKIYISGDNNKIIIGENVKVVEKLDIYCHELGNDRTIEIGDFTTMYKTVMYNYDNKSSIFVGNDCMFAYNTVLYNTDGHSIFNNGKLVNRAEKLTVGNHVWLCENANVLKNSFVPDNSIVARNALLSGKFEIKNAVYGGVPAKLIKENIDWDRRTVNEVESLNAKL